MDGEEIIRQKAGAGIGIIPGEVKLGQKLDGYQVVLAGIKEGDRIVTSANFLIDSESSLKAAMAGMKH